MSLGCNCYDWGTEEKEGTFFWYNGSWCIRSKGGDFRRIYFCPMCSDKLEQPQAATCFTGETLSMKKRVEELEELAYNFATGKDDGQPIVEYVHKKLADL